MSNDSTIEQLIRSNIPLGRKAATGFEQLKCACCNDYKTRAGFRFESGKVRYHCFNCSTEQSYNEQHQKMSDEFREILNAFSINDDQINLILSKKFFTAPVFVKKGDVVKPTFTLPQRVELPPKSYPLSEETDSLWKEVAIEYLLYRGLHTEDYTWYLSNDRKFRSKLIIPYFRNGEVIYWQARELDDSSNGPRYVNPPVSRNNILFNFDELFRYTKEPLFVNEGVLDSISIGQNAIALAGSTLNEFKVEMLRRVRDREIIFILDKDKNGKALGESVVKHGWTISYIEGELTDPNDALMKMGKLWMLNNILQNRKTNFAALLWLQSIKIKEKAEV